METRKFTATLIKVADKEAGYIEIPFDVEKEYGAKRVKVVAQLEGVTYRGSVVRMGTDCHILGIPKEIRLKMGKTFGDTIAVEIAEDKAERVVEMPADFGQLLAENEVAQSFFQSLSFSNQRRYVLWIESAKKEETRANRARQAIEMLMNKQLK